MITNEERSNPEITKVVESILLDFISENPTGAFKNADLEDEVRSKLGDKYQDVNILPHISWALDMLHSNRMVKKIGPGVWQSIDDPDPVYAERQTGYSPEGEFSRRGKNFLTKMTPTERKKFNRDVSGAKVSVKMLKNAGLDEKQIYDAIAKGGTQFNPVAIKVAIRKVFSLPGTAGTSTDEPEVDPSVFGVDFEK